MTEKEKMLAGMIYDANYDAEIVNERIKCKDLCHEFNLLAPSDIHKQREIIIKLLGKTNGLFTITAPFWCDYGYNIEIGENFYVNHNCIILDAAKVVFGDNMFIGPHCGFYTAGHPIDMGRRSLGLEYASPITIGNNVWIGGGVQVMPGVIIGDNSVIGAGSVVTRSIPGNVVAVGNPCRVLREITEEDKHV